MIDLYKEGYELSFNVQLYKRGGGNGSMNINTSFAVDVTLENLAAILIDMKELQEEFKRKYGTED